MKTLLTTSLIIPTLAVSLNAAASSHKTDAEYLTQCKAGILTEFTDSKVRSMNMKSRRNLFTSKFKVSGAEGKTVVTCSIAKDTSSVSLSCTDSSICPSHLIAKK